MRRVTTQRGDRSGVRHRPGGTISSGTQYDYGTVSGGTIISGGEQIVEAGAAASNMTVDSGGLDYLVSGGTAVGTTISGGTLEVTSGATGGNVTFAIGGILQLDSLVAFGGTISGFHLGDEIDLRGLAFNASGHADREQRRGGRDADFARAIHGSEFQRHLGRRRGHADHRSARRRHD
jgi:autotransporter passenger strand-loop-strand repeat protein